MGMLTYHRERHRDFFSFAFLISCLKCGGKGCFHEDYLSRKHLLIGARIKKKEIFEKV